MKTRDLVPFIKNTRFYHPIRNIYLRTIKRPYWKSYILASRRFFRQFIPPGSTVFDIGANCGEYTQCFLAVGAGKVVAVEPTPHFVTELRRIRDPRLVVVPGAAGKERGKAVLNVSKFSSLNSLSTNWLEMIIQHVPDGDPQWAGQIEVNVFSLDSLMEEYGIPAFIKIDVEGYEIEVLKGLTKSPQFLNFEFHCGLIDSTIACLQQPCFPPQARFNYVMYDLSNTYVPPPFALIEWCDLQSMIRIANTTLRSFGPMRYGDIFVRA